MNLKNIKQKKNDRIISVSVLGNKNKTSLNDQLKFKALEEGTFYARDLVSEQVMFYTQMNMRKELHL